MCSIAFSCFGGGLGFKAFRLLGLPGFSGAWDTRALEIDGERLSNLFDKENGGVANENVEEVQV